MELKKYNMSGKEVGRVSVRDEIFAAANDLSVHPQTITDVVKAQLANERQGTVSTKTRSFVRGGGRKPWRQKGTGRARQGSTRSPIWPGGACVFGPLPKVYDLRPPKKMVDKALKGVLTNKASEDLVRVVENLSLETGKARDVRNLLKSFKLAKALLVVTEITETAKRAASNLPNVKLVTPMGVNVVDLLRYKHLVISDKAVTKLEEALK